MVALLYVFDTSSFVELFKFYPKRFPSLFKVFDEIVADGQLISVREGYREIEERADALTDWAKVNKSIFQDPMLEEAQAVAEIFQITHFQQSLEQKKLLKGGPFADPFLIAKGRVLGATVVTQEKGKPNAAKIPNICNHFSVQCMNLTTGTKVDYLRPARVIHV